MSWTEFDCVVVGDAAVMARALRLASRVMERDANRMRSSVKGSKNNNNKNSSVGPTIFCSVRHNVRVADISDFILTMYQKATGVDLNQFHHHHYGGDDHQHTGHSHN